MTLRRVLLGRGAIDGIDALLPPARSAGGPLLLLADPNTRAAAGADVARALRGSGHDVVEVIAGGGAGEAPPRADDRTLDRLRPSLAARPSRIVAVGSGTISDLGKVLAEEADAALITVGTAASMNGYSSAIAALTIGGLKVTRAARPAEAVVIDTGVIASAPARLNRAGFGDLVSKPVSGADWTLARMLFGETLCPTAMSIADEAVHSARKHADGIGRGDGDALEALSEALILSGLSMSIAGSSAPASGGEHLISHYLDISSPHGAAPEASDAPDGAAHGGFLHGEQVAVGTLVSIALYERLRRTGPPSAEPAAGGEPGGARDGRRIGEETAEAIAAQHRSLPPEAREAVVAEALAKAARAPRGAARRRRIAERWEALWSALAPQLSPAAGLDADLARAGVPRRFSGIGVDAARAARTIRVARHMRNRYTVLDLAADCGRLDGWADEIAAELAG